MSARGQRRMRIRKLLNEHVVSSQDQLVELLADEGIQVTQATLSRDLRDMGVSKKRASDGGIRYQLDPKARYLKMLREVVGMEIQGVQHNGHLIVIRTLSGRAEGVAAYIDGRSHPDVLGTVAGDDTVLVVPRDISCCDQLVAEIEDLAAGEEKPS